MKKYWKTKINNLLEKIENHDFDWNYEEDQLKSLLTILDYEDHVQFYDYIQEKVARISNTLKGKVETEKYAYNVPVGDCIVSIPLPDQDVVGFQETVKEMRKLDRSKPELKEHYIHMLQNEALEVYEEIIEPEEELEEEENLFTVQEFEEIEIIPPDPGLEPNREILIYS